MNNEQMIAALLREAEGVANNMGMDKTKRAKKLTLIRNEVEAYGGDSKLIAGTTEAGAPARATRTSKQATARRKRKAN